MYILETIPNYNLSIAGSNWKELRSMDLPSFIVYGWRRDQEYFYVGLTTNVNVRFNYHKQLKNIELSDFVDVWFCATKFQMQQLERYLINKYKPQFNTYNNNKRARDHAVGRTPTLAYIQKKEKLG